MQYQGGQLQRYGASSFAHYYYEQDHPFSQTIDNASLDRHLDEGERAWIVWDRIYATRPHVPVTARVEEYRFGSTSLLWVTPQARAEWPAHAMSWSATVICRALPEMEFAGRTNENIPCNN